MPRQARVVIPETPHHVVQRGNRRQRTFFSPKDYRTYLAIAAEAFREAEVEVWAYCLMPNHVHLVVVPAAADGLAKAIGETHLRYTRHINRREGWSGYLWQGRFQSYPMDEDYWLTCTRYVGLNPVRAGLVERATDWPWSSVRAHLSGQSDSLLSTAPLAERLGGDVATFFDIDVGEADRDRLREAAWAGRPLGSERWVSGLEARTGRVLTKPKIGRPTEFEAARDRFRKLLLEGIASPPAGPPDFDELFARALGLRK